MSPEKKERWPTTISVAIAVENGNRALLLVHKKGRDQWGLAAGGLQQGETLTEAAYRELREETGLGPEDTDGLFGLKEVFVIPGDTKTSLGVVFFTRIKMILPKEGLRVEGNEEIDFVQPFTDIELSKLIHGEPGKIYKPEFNLLAFNAWFDWLKDF